MSASVEDPAGSPAGSERGLRGRVWVYAVAFVMLLVSTYLQFSGAIGTGGLTVVWSSIGLSVAAAVVAAAAILLPEGAAGPLSGDSPGGRESDAAGDEAPPADEPKTP